MSQLTYKLPEDLAAAVKTNLADWQAGDKVSRLWQQDASLWTNTDEAMAGMARHHRGADREHLTHCKSSPQKSRAPASPTFFCLAWADPASAPKFWQKTYGQSPGFPQLHVLDSTDPAQIKAFETKSIRRKRCL